MSGGASRRSDHAVHAYANRGLYHYPTPEPAVRSLLIVEAAALIALYHVERRSRIAA
jgi:hypothetical protein